MRRQLNLSFTLDANELVDLLILKELVEVMAESLPLDVQLVGEVSVKEALQTFVIENLHTNAWFITNQKSKDAAWLHFMDEKGYHEIDDNDFEIFVVQ